MKKTGLSKGLRRSQIDRTLAQLEGLSLNRPKDGWIKTAREVLGMTQKQLAERMRISSPTLSQLEKAEVEGSTTIKSIERAASALHCRLVYVFVPEGGSFDELIREKAQEAASRAIEMASVSMRLESQDIDDELQRIQIKQLAEDLVRNADKRVWEMPK